MKSRTFTCEECKHRLVGTTLHATTAYIKVIKGEQQLVCKKCYGLKGEKYASND